MKEDFYIAGLTQGNEQVFREIFEEYHTRLCYFAATFLVTGQDAEDVVQEAFVKLWQRREHFPELNAVKAFLYITVKNSCLNIYKHNKVVRKYEGRLEEEWESDVMARIIESEVLENVFQALEKLPAGCRNVLQLSYFEGMKHKDIASHLQVSVNTVKTQKMRGIQLLKKLLGGSFFTFFLHHHW
ncbi:RNA polymerase sigma factor [Chitinophaga alhagiae]|uniref:RNA polymerase sigma factor n=1 Tax=Chitinophaga alhagiae TaxID=2203219 RepID=UPI000E5AFE17|nr:RNA polymerase sigma-70 factor [Chitinophaga alhagiae]